METEELNNELYNKRIRQKNYVREKSPVHLTLPQERTRRVPKWFLFLALGLFAAGAFAAYFLFFKGDNDDSAAFTKNATVLGDTARVKAMAQKGSLPTHTASAPAAQKTIKNEPAPPAKVPPPVEPTTAAASPQGGDEAKPIVSNSPARNTIAPVTASASASPAKVKYKVLSKAYVYNEPQEGARRKSSVILQRNSDDAFNALDKKNGFVYAVVTDRQGQTFRGWFRKKDLQPVVTTVNDDDIK